MLLYELGIATSQTTTGNPLLEFQAGSGRPASILEMGVFLNAATASTIQLGRPGNTPTGGTPQVATAGINRLPSTPNSTGGVIIASWTVAPTIPAAGNIHRRIGLAAAVGNGMIWSWNPGEMVVDPTRTGSLILWSLSTVSVLNTYIKWLE